MSERKALPIELLNESLVRRIQQGYAICASLQGQLRKHDYSENELEGDVVVHFECGVDVWKAVAKQFEVSLAETCFLLSPNGKVIASSNDLDFIRRECHRLRDNMIFVVKNKIPSTNTPVISDGGTHKDKGSVRRKTADEWVTTFTAREHPPTASATLSKTSADMTISEASKLIHPLDSVKESVEAPKGNDDTATKGTRVAIKFTDGRPRIIIDVDDITTYTLNNLLRDVNEPLISNLVCDYPRRTFDLSNDLHKTLQELSLDSNPSLTAVVPGIAPARSANIVSPNVMSSVFAWLLSVLTAIWEWIKLFVAGGSTAHAGRPNLRGESNVRPPRGSGGEPGRPTSDTRKSNQYWNGDSTVFEGEPENEDDKKNN